MYIKKSRLIIGIVAIVLATAFLTVCVVNPFGITHLSDFFKFSFVTRVIGSQYYEDVDMNEAANGAIAGVAASTGDPYTNYMWGETADEYMETISGSYSGVGLYIENDTEHDLISVVSPIKGSPAEAAGIMTGDKIIKIDGEIFPGSQLAEAAAHMKGEEGTEVTLTLRSETESEHDITLTRQMIEIENVESKMLDSEIGYISIIQFTENVADNFKEQYNQLKEQQMKSLIIDLRNNPGGLLEEVSRIAGMFVPDGEIITYTMSKSGHKNEYRADSDDNPGKADMPVVILMNGGSASASEVLAGALKDHGIATLIGEKSYGKGIVQGVMSFGGDILSVTVSRYYTPSGICIHGEGIKPDIEVEMSAEKTAAISTSEAEEDEQLQAAIEHLKK